MALVLVTALLAASCGGDGGDTDAAATTTEAASASTTAAPASQGSSDPTVVDQALIDAAKKEGKLVWYSAFHDETNNKPVVEAFEKEYGIDVETTRLVSGELSQKYLAEADSGRIFADVISVSDLPALKTGLDKGYLTPLQDLGIPGFPEEYPEKFVLEEYGTAVIWVGLTGLAVNTQRVDEADAPTTWEELADPKWADKLLVSEPTSSSAYISFFDGLMDQYGEEYLQAIGQNIRQVYPSQVPNVNALGAGEGDVSLFTLCATVCAAEQSGAPVKQVQPTDRPMGVEFMFGVSTEAPHPNAAKLFAHFLLFGEGQKALNASDDSAYGPYHDQEDLADYQRALDGFLERQDKILELLGLTK